MSNQQIIFRRGPMINRANIAFSPSCPKPFVDNCRKAKLCDR